MKVFNKLKESFRTKYAGKVFPSYYGFVAKVLAFLTAVVSLFIFENYVIGLLTFFWAFALIDFTNIVIRKKKESALKDPEQLYKLSAILPNELDSIRKKMAWCKVMVCIFMIPFAFGDIELNAFVLFFFFMAIPLLCAFSCKSFYIRGNKKGIITNKGPEDPWYKGVPGFNASGIYTGSSTAIGGMSN